MTLQRKVLGYIIKNGSISAREALLDLDITSASLTRRICDLEEKGVAIVRTQKKHPVTGKRYTRYTVAESSHKDWSASGQVLYSRLKDTVERYGLRAA